MMPQLATAPPPTRTPLPPALMPKRLPQPMALPLTPTLPWAMSRKLSPLSTTWPLLRQLPPLSTTWPLPPLSTTWPLLRQPSPLSITWRLPPLSTTWPLLQQPSPLSTTWPLVLTPLSPSLPLRRLRVAMDSGPGQPRSSIRKSTLLRLSKTRMLPKLRSDWDVFYFLFSLLDWDQGLNSYDSYDGTDLCGLTELIASGKQSAQRLGNGLMISGVQCMMGFARWAFFTFSSWVGDFVEEFSIIVDSHIEWECQKRISLLPHCGQWLSNIGRLSNLRQVDKVI
ncbi:hypothetical protein GE09DRAFT_206575 [Coniochaeta sp. 2T2.1]|nr:hypothetical protein GE09DRAFT_206575 [Coniochaeta sp. 2T2.1]